MKQANGGIVVDADVARASADPSHSDRALACARALLAIRSDETLRVAFEGELHQEWTEHQGRFARKWLVSMYARRRVSRYDAVPAWAALRMAIEALSDRFRSTATKDRHLVELARHDGWRIVSLDGKARRAFVRACGACKELQRIAWADPTQAETSGWLEAGARDEAFLLGDSSA